MFLSIGNTLTEIWPVVFQMSALSFESLDLFESGAGTMGLSLEEVEKLPKCKTTDKDSVDASGEKISCSVCLQVLKFARNFIKPLSI